MADSEAESQAPPLNAEERKQVERRRGISALVVYESVRRQGEEELDRPAAALWWSGVAAGLSMASSLIAEGLIRAHLPDAAWRPLIQQFGYSFGFLMLVLGRQQLFTENTLTAVVPVLARPDLGKFGKLAKLWTVVLAANLTGAHLGAWALSNTPVFSPAIQRAFNEISHEAIAVAPMEAVVKGIAAGWLIAMMVWMLSAIETGQVAVIILMTYLVGLGSLTHIVAGSIEALFLVWNGSITWWHFALHYALPTLAGNTIGGVSLVAALNHGQVVAGQG